MSNNDPSPASLGTMLGAGESFVAKGKTYTIKPIALKHVKDFMDDNLSIGVQLFSVANKESSEKINKWLLGYAIDEKGESLSLEKAMADDWDVVDLKNFFTKMCDLSGS